MFGRSAGKSGKWLEKLLTEKINNEFPAVILEHSSLLQELPEKVERLSDLYKYKPEITVIRNIGTLPSPQYLTAGKLHTFHIQVSLEFLEWAGVRALPNHLRIVRAPHRLNYLMNAREIASFLCFHLTVLENLDSDIQRCLEWLGRWNLFSEEHPRLARMAFEEGQIKMEEVLDDFETKRFLKQSRKDAAKREYE